MRRLIPFFIFFFPLHSFSQAKDTLDSFQFENSDPLSYEASEDEIIQKIEVDMIYPIDEGARTPARRLKDFRAGEQERLKSIN